MNRYMLIESESRYSLKVAFRQSDGVLKILTEEEILAVLLDYERMTSLPHVPTVSTSTAHEC